MQQRWYQDKKKRLISYFIFQEAQQWNPSPLVWWGWQDLTGPEVPLSEWQPEEERWSPGWYPSLLPLRPVSRHPCQIQTFVLMLLSLMKKEEYINVAFRIVKKSTPNLHIWKPIKELTQMTRFLVALNVTRLSHIWATWRLMKKSTTKRNCTDKSCMLLFTVELWQTTN